MTNFLKIERALLLTREVKKAQAEIIMEVKEVQEEIIMENLGARVYNLQVKAIPEEAAKEVTNETKREDNNLETGEVQNHLRKEEVLVRKLNAYGAEAQTIKLWTVPDSRTFVVPDAKIVDSSTKPRIAIKDDQTIKVQEEVIEEETRGKVWTREEKESMLWNLKRQLIPLYL